MAFELRIKNIGKITDAKLHIGGFTVFAGPNNTGKSYVSKLLYSLFDGINANYLLTSFHHLIHPLMEVLRKLIREREKEGQNKHRNSKADKLYLEISEWENMFKECALDDFDDINKILSGFADFIKKWRKAYRSYADSATSKSKKRDAHTHDSTSEQSLEVTKILDDLEENLRGMDGNHLISNGISIKLISNLIRNFQISEPSRIIRARSRSAKISIKGIGAFQFRDGKDGKSIHFEIQDPGVRQLQEYSRVVYLESPVYWKLKSALENIRLAPRYSESTNRIRISGVPGYFYDLARALKEEYSGKVAFPELYERITKRTIGGKITISDIGDLEFQEKGKNFSLPLTAMGVINLGILALLIERKIIDKGAFLFIDEPEAHLHPAWQVKVAEVLLDLSRLGVNVVIATHSADIMKFIEVAVKKNPEYEELIALNHFSVEGIKNGEEDFDVKLANIKQELTKPFSDLYMEGLL